MPLPVDKDKIIAEVHFKASLSSGPGGQHVNKVNTKIELRFYIDDSKLFSEEEKGILKEKLANKINNDGYLVLSSQSERTQLKNKEKAVEKFFLLLEKALKPVKKRKPTKPTKASKEKRLKEKHIQSEKKSGRKPASRQGRDVDL